MVKINFFAKYYSFIWFYPNIIVTFGTIYIELLLII
jgi:hypothetical protein